MGVKRLIDKYERQIQEIQRDRIGLRAEQVKLAGVNKTEFNKVKAKADRINTEVFVLSSVVRDLRRLDDE